MDQALQRPQPAPSVDSRAIEDLARRIDDVRASIERQTGSQPDTAKLEAVLRDISQKLDRPPAPAANPDALAAMFQDLGARIDQRVNPTLDIKPLEQALRTLGDRPIEIDTTPIENLMRDLGAKLAAPTAVDMRPFEGLLREINQKLDRDATAKVDPKFVEHDPRPRRSHRPAGVATGRASTPTRWRTRFHNPRPSRRFATGRLVEERARSAHGRRSDRRTRRDAQNPAIDAQAGRFVEVRARSAQVADLIAELDATRRTMQSAPAPDASSKSALDQHMVADLIAELDATRRTMQSLPATAARGNDDIADGLADLRAEQTNTDKRTQTRLVDLQDILERLVNRLGRIEDEVARVDDSPRARAPGGAAVAQKVPFSEVVDPAHANGAALRDIPDRGAARPTRDGLGELPRGGKANLAGEAAARRSLDGADFLLEPGASLDRARDREPADLSNPKSAINAHIAAARRAAQAALTEGAAKDRNPKLATVSNETAKAPTARPSAKPRRSSRRSGGRSFSAPRWSR